jgi:hypothetical protein
LACHEQAVETSRRKWRWYAAFGALAGACAGVVLGLLISIFRPEALLWNVLAWTVAAVSYGVMAASTFWLIRRPDRDQPSPAASPNATSA